MIESFINYLVCPQSGDKLDVISDKRITSELPGTYQEFGGPKACVETWVGNQSLSFFYPVINHVLILIPDIACQMLGEKIKFPDLKCSSVNPFSQNREYINVDDYDNFNEVFHKDELSLRELPSGAKIIVDYLSSQPRALQYFETGDNGRKFCVDLDFFTLSDSENQDNTLKVCADASLQIFREGSIDYAMCNSVHHISELSTQFYKNVWNALSTRGKFFGIEAQGFQAKIVVFIIQSTPMFLLRALFSASKLLGSSKQSRLKPIFSLVNNIWEEQPLHWKWLSKSIEDRLAEAGVVKFAKITKTRFHCHYSFQKDP